ncbi:hypothetical protein MCG45_15790 [Clostridium perfringens]|uniref:tubulin-like doman-containing protein n=1 Tax=Clostridium perfringens TaxID=1502 RepID=UPI001F07004A|nr:tubulin-like doman-containing protein [Clostridium perfringens]MCH1964291.1 hypothetical protein [Clostridium perfringens]
MLKDEFVILGMGQGGGKMTKPFYDSGYRSFFINTSYDDLSSLGVKNDYVYHIPAAKGCAKNRKTAMEYAQNYYENMVGKLLDTHPTGNVFIAHYTLGGGTGGGLTNFILAVLRQKLNSMGRKNAIIIAVAAVPESYESYHIQNNANAALKELYKMVDAKVVNQYFLINNDSREDLRSINTENMLLLDRWIEGETANNDSNADESERIDLFKLKGGAMLFDFSAENKEEFGNALKTAYDNTIYCTPSKKPLAIGMALNKNLKRKEIISDIEEVVGYSPKHHITPTENSNVIMLAGLPKNPNIENNIIKIANEKYEKINSEEKIESEDISMKTFDKKEEKIDDVSFESIEDVMNLFR